MIYLALGSDSLLVLSRCGLLDVENFVVDAVRSGLEAVVGLLGGREGDEAEPTEIEKSLMNLRFQAKFSPH